MEDDFKQLYRRHQTTWQARDEEEDQSLDHVTWYWRFALVATTARLAAALLVTSTVSVVAALGDGGTLAPPYK